MRERRGARAIRAQKVWPCQLHGFRCDERARSVGSPRGGSRCPMPVRTSARIENRTSNVIGRVRRLRQLIRRVF
jgi:hypothetical protein